MKITSAEFVRGVQNVEDVPRDGLKEIAFSGRSNVGKSSLINALLNRKKLAKTSSTPGKTRQLNYFKINDKFYLVDLPGYGFAKVSHAEKERWKNLIESYFHQSEQLKGVVSIIDSRIGPTPLDTQLFEWLANLKIPIVIVATKADKLSKSALKKQLAKITEKVGDRFTQNILPFSSVTGMGKDKIWRKILNLLEYER